jgi:ribosome-associated translation inhibitor RaiA
MRRPDFAGSANTEPANYVHVAMLGVEDTDALEQYVQDRVARQSRRGSEVLWYEVVLYGNVRRSRHECSARVTAHLRDKDVFVAQTNPNSFLAARDVFDVLAQRLHRVRDVRKSRAHGSQRHQKNPVHP